MPKHCAEFRNGKCRQYVNQIIVTDHNETNSLSFMQQNLRHIWGDMMHYRPPSDIWADVSPCFLGIYANEHAIVNIQLNVVACPTYQDKFIRDMFLHRLCDFRL